MLMWRKVICRWIAFALLASLASFSQQTTGAKDTSDRAPVVIWSADLNGNHETPVVSTKATAKAEFTFDFSTHTAKFRLTPENLQDVSKVLLLAKGPGTKIKGATILALYDAAAGSAFPKTGAYAPTFTGNAFNQIVNTVLNGVGVVEVTTKTHPDGEVLGLVEMHKSYQ